MNTIKITSDMLLCKECGTPIPKGQTACPNPKCPSKKPLHGKLKNLTLEIHLEEA